jgi:hypothetical protein
MTPWGTPGLMVNVYDPKPFAGVAPADVAGKGMPAALFSA